ncbi:LysE family translocator [Leeia oryzae]|uniref:LysE family translocator n=1 Tax=Leeia oryzae TaxID=356662 RepID=UPI0003769B1A|nr:LysE family translocator [Leeia oryzae]
MELHQWLLLAGTCLLGAMTPGLSLAIVVRHASDGGKRNGFATAFGHGCGIFVHALACVLGIALLLQTYPLVFQMMSWAGALYLIWTGSQILRSLKPAAHSAGHTDQRATQRTSYHSFLDGLMVGLLNPNLILFFLSLFSQFIHPGASQLVKAELVLTPPILDIAWFMLVVVVLNHLPKGDGMQKLKRPLTGLMGLVLITLGSRLFFM